MGSARCSRVTGTRASARYSAAVRCMPSWRKAGPVLSRAWIGRDNVPRRHLSVDGGHGRDRVRRRRGDLCGPRSRRDLPGRAIRGVELGRLAVRLGLHSANAAAESFRPRDARDGARRDRPVRRGAPGRAAWARARWGRRPADRPATCGVTSWAYVRQAILDLEGGSTGCVRGARSAPRRWGSGSEPRSPIPAVCEPRPRHELVRRLRYGAPGGLPASKAAGTAAAARFRPPPRDRGSGPRAQPRAGPGGHPSAGGAPPRRRGGPALPLGPPPDVGGAGTWRRRVRPGAPASSGGVGYSRGDRFARSSVAGRASWPRQIGGTAS